MKPNITFIVPAFNCEATVSECVESIIEGNLEEGDEIVVVDDGSDDATCSVVSELSQRYPVIRVIRHGRNKGGGASRNTAVENATSPIIFCLDSDNVLVPKSIERLKQYLVSSGADVACFQELHYFRGNKQDVTHKWAFREGLNTLADCLAGPVTPGASGNYMYTKESWAKAGGYPESSGAMDAWGFGFRQLATGSKMMVMPKSFYYHRFGHDSYWVRESRTRNVSVLALQIVIPYLDLIDGADGDYIRSEKGMYSWFDTLNERPIRLKSGQKGTTGTIHREPFPARMIRVLRRWR